MTPRAVFICMPEITCGELHTSVAHLNQSRTRPKWRVQQLILFMLWVVLLLLLWLLLSEVYYVSLLDLWSKGWIVLLTTQPSSGSNYHFSLFWRGWHARDKFCHFSHLELTYKMWYYSLFNKLSFKNDLGLKNTVSTINECADNLPINSA